MRVQLLFAARGGCTDALFARLDDEGRRAKAARGAARVIGLTQHADDMFPLANPLAARSRPYSSCRRRPPTTATRSSVRCRARSIAWTM